MGCNVSSLEQNDGPVVCLAHASNHDVHRQSHLSSAPLENEKLAGDLAPERAPSPGRVEVEAVPVKVRDRLSAFDEGVYPRPDVQSAYCSDDCFGSGSGLSAGRVSGLADRRWAKAQDWTTMTGVISRGRQRSRCASRLRARTR